MALMKEFKEFVARGNVVDLAVAVVIGAAFGAIVGSLVKDIVMPPRGLALGKVDFSNLFLVLKEGSTPGPYPSVAEAANVKECLYCCTRIPVKATRCPNCTSELGNGIAR